MWRGLSILLLATACLSVGTGTSAAVPAGKLYGGGFVAGRSASLIETVRCVRGHCSSSRSETAGCRPGRTYRTHYCAATRCRSSGRVYCICPCPGSR